MQSRNVLIPRNVYEAMMTYIEEHKDNLPYDHNLQIVVEGLYTKWLKEFDRERYAERFLKGP